MQIIIKFAVGSFFGEAHPNFQIAGRPQPLIYATDCETSKLQLQEQYVLHNQHEL